jgi:hypothetical protein
MSGRLEPKSFLKELQLIEKNREANPAPHFRIITPILK